MNAWTKCETDAAQAKMDASKKVKGKVVEVARHPGQTPFERFAEKEMHRMFGQWLNLRRIPFREDRMDKATTGPVGFPDFSVFCRGKTLFVEFKSEGGKLRVEQEAWRVKLALEGFDYLTAFSAQQAMDWVTGKLLRP
jgi:hypothetical protein